MRARRSWAWPLVPVYAAVVALKDWLRRAGVLRVRRLRRPVVSVGSISAGGAGKTPVVIALAKMLGECGWAVDVLSRGFGRSGTGVERAGELEEKQIPLGNDRKKGKGQRPTVFMNAAERFGDEPVVMARAGIAVWVGADRLAAGRAAEGWNGGGSGEKQVPRLSPRNDRKKSKDAKDAMADGSAEATASRGVHLLDDGFQHRALAREFDVVLVTAEDLEDALLPAGNLREGLGALKRADAVVVREEELEAVRERVGARMREGAQMWLVRRRLEFPAPLFVFGAGLRPVAFCTIARPEGFQAMLAEAGCGVVETVAFEDHHAYAMRDVERIVEVARGLNATGLVTTEKDAVKLPAAMRERLETVGPLMVVALEAVFVDEDAVMRALETRMEARAS